jgi:hypothetical protein
MVTKNNNGERKKRKTKRSWHEGIETAMKTRYLEVGKWMKRN